MSHSCSCYDRCELSAPILLNMFLPTNCVDLMRIHFHHHLLSVLSPECVIGCVDLLSLLNFVHFIPPFFVVRSYVSSLSLLDVWRTSVWTFSVDDYLMLQVLTCLKLIPFRFTFNIGVWYWILSHCRSVLLLQEKVPVWYLSRECETVKDDMVNFLFRL